MSPSLWPCTPVPDSEGAVWQWQITSPAQLCALRLAVTRVLDAAAADRAVGAENGDETIGERMLLAVDELAANGLRHGTVPVTARIVGDRQGWLVDVSDGDTRHGPEPAVGRDPALGGMGLHLVAALSTGRGWVVADGRKHVWACLPWI
jgi:hypothetical protein